LRIGQSGQSSPRFRHRDPQRAQRGLDQRPCPHVQPIERQVRLPAKRTRSAPLSAIIDQGRVGNIEAAGSVQQGRGLRACVGAVFRLTRHRRQSLNCQLARPVTAAAQAGSWGFGLRCLVILTRPGQRHGIDRQIAALAAEQHRPVLAQSAVLPTFKPPRSPPAQARTSGLHRPLIVTSRRSGCAG